MELPAIDPAMPATLGPVRLGINGRMRDFAGFPMLLVPDAPLGSQDGAVQSRSSAVLLPGLDEGNQVSPHATDLRRKSCWDRPKAALEGPAGGILAIFGQQRAEVLHLGRGLLQ